VAMARPRSATLDPLPRSRAAEAATDPAGLVEPVGQVAPDPEAQAITDPAGPVDLVTTDLAGQAALVTTDPADLVDRVITGLVDLVITGPADRAAPDSTDLVDQAVLEHGMAMTTAVTSTALRGETGPHPGVVASRRDRHGTGRFRRPVDRGTMARSITGATTKTRSGISSSTSGASTSSESGFRCEDDPAIRS
jgi:hypothetical protein